MAVGIAMTRKDKGAALDDAEMRGRLARPGTVAMRADWTRPDAGISRYLASFDRFGIPPEKP